MINQFKKLIRDLIEKQLKLKFIWLKNKEIKGHIVIQSIAN